jgi:hypothetical protein
MENPVSVLKAAINPSTIIKGVVGTLVVFAIFDLLGQSDFIFRPVSWLRAKFAAKGS